MPDGGRMYFSDSSPAVRSIWACDYDVASGQPGEPALIFDTRAVAGRAQPDDAHMHRIEAGMGEGRHHDRGDALGGHV